MAAAKVTENRNEKCQGCLYDFRAPGHIDFDELRGLLAGLEDKLRDRGQWITD